jgi:chromosome segregation ATPase
VLDTKAKKATSDLNKLKKQAELKDESHLKELSSVRDSLVSQNAKLDQTLTELENRKKEIAIYEKKHAKVQQIENENLSLQAKVAELTKQMAEIEENRAVCIKTEASVFDEFQSEMNAIGERNATLEKEYLSDKSLIEFLKDIFQKEHAKVKEMDAEILELRKGILTLVSFKQKTNQLKLVIL